MDTLVDTVVDDRYKIIRLIGEGGMGVVYEAHQISVDRRVAIKMLHKELASDEGWVRRFYNEAKSCSMLEHPNTVRIFDFGQTKQGQLFIAMEYLDGESLKQAIWESGTISPERTLRILHQVCAALVEAHAAGIVHRDIKPDNIFLLQMAGAPDFVKVLDFSVAKLKSQEGPNTKAGMTFGTPHYMSPEQAKGKSSDPRTDLFSLGVIGYEMLTGRLPFEGDKPSEVLLQLSNQPLPPFPTSVPLAAQNIIFQATEKTVKRRFGNASEMLLACEQALRQLPGDQSHHRAASSSFTNPQQGHEKVNFGIWASAILLGGALGAGLFALTQL